MASSDANSNARATMSAKPGPEPQAKAESTTKDVAVRDSTVSENQDAALAESRELDERVHYIDDVSQLQLELEAAGNRLVILELMAEGVCETGLFEPDDGWTPEWDEKQKAKLAVCENVRHEFVRMASDTPNVRFLETMQAEDASSGLCKHLGISHFPAVCFFKNKELVWKTHGSASMTGNTSEALLYYSENNRLKSSDHVHEMDTEEQYDAFMASEGIDNPADLKVVMFSTPMCTPCIHVYPSFVTLAMNFKGIADFARVELHDSAEEQQPIFQRLRVIEVPTFVLYYKGEEVSRTVSSQRGDLIGHVLQTVMKLGITPPSPKKK